MPVTDIPMMRDALLRQHLEDIREKELRKLRADTVEYERLSEMHKVSTSHLMSIIMKTEAGGKGGLFESTRLQP